MVDQNEARIEGKKRDLALFNLAIDSKLRGCDVVAVRFDDVAPEWLLDGLSDHSLELEEDGPTSQVRIDRSDPPSD